jgi:hypothetical protein
MGGSRRAGGRSGVEPGASGDGPFSLGMIEN